MDELPKLSRLSIGEKDQLIRDLWLLVRSLGGSSHHAASEGKGTGRATWAEQLQFEQAKRGKLAFDVPGIRSRFLGTMIHDGWKPDRDRRCKHGLCNAHPLRKSTDLFEELHPAWAGRMIELLVAACHV